MFINGALIYTEVHQAHEPKATVIITHGLAQHAQDFIEVTKLLVKAGYHVIVYDIRGHGRSQGKRGSSEGFSSFSSDLKALIDYAKVSLELPVYLLGHSMGGVITLLTALETDVSGVIISSTPFETPKKLSLFKWIGYRYLGFLKFKTNFKDSNLSTLPYVERINPFDLKFFRLRLVGDVLIKGLKHLKKHINTYQLPTLLLYGKEDVMTTLQDANQLYEHMGNEDKTLKLYPNTKHNVFQETKTPEIIQDVIGWLEDKNTQKKDETLD